VNACSGRTLAREFGLSAAELGFLTGVYFFSFGCSSSAGRAARPLRPAPRERHAPRARRGGRPGFAFSQSFETLVLSRALIGLGVSACLMA
jgi:hypothetical protein